MVHRIALVGGVVAAGAILALALGAGSLFARSESLAATDMASLPTAAPTAQTQVDTVYVKPAPAPQVIHVTQTTHPNVARRTPRVVVVNRPAHGGDGENEHGDGGRGDD